MNKIAKNKIADEIALIFSMTIGAMISWVKLIKSYYDEDHAAFEDWSPKYSETFVTDWTSKITECSNIPTSNQDSSVLQGKTETLQSLMKKGRMAYKKLKNFVLDAFSTSPAIQNEFGLNKYKSVRNNQKEFGKFLVNLNTAANNYKVKLIEKGYTQLMIDDLKTVGESISNAETDQENYKGAKGVLTEDRKIKLNELYLLTRGVCEEGKLIFVDSPAKAARYLLPAVAAGEDTVPTPTDPPVPTPTSGS